MAERIRTNAQGLVEGFDDETGEVLWVQAQKKSYKNGEPRRSNGPGRGRRTKVDNETHHYVRDGYGRKLWVPKGTNPDHLPQLIYPYAQVTVDHILAKVTEGYTVTAIGKMEGMPPQHIIYKWVREHPEFRAQMKAAKAARAEVFHDRVIESAERADEDTVAAERLRVDAYKWAASVNDPDTFGSRTKITGDPDAPLGFIIQTGVPESPKEVEAEQAPASLTHSNEGAE